MQNLLIFNDPPYGTERSFNGLRLVRALCTTDEEVAVFLMADAVSCASHGQKVPHGFYNLELMLNSVIRQGRMFLCGTCMDARELTDKVVVAGAKRNTMKELAELTLAADKVLVL